MKNTMKNTSRKTIWIGSALLLVAVVIIAIQGYTLAKNHETTQTLAANKEVYYAFTNGVLRDKNIGVIDKVVSPSMIEHEPAPPGIPAGREGLKKLFPLFYQAFPDLNVKIEDVVAQGDRVVGRITISGTQTGTYAGIPPTGKKVSYQVIDIMRMKDGKIIEHWGVGDNLSLLTQLGAIKQ
jgi:predicted ester cyclase